jgi:HEAT repeat protein
VGAAAATPVVLARLAELLRDPELYVPAAAAGAVPGVGAAAATPVVLARLAELLRDPDWYVRWAAAGAWAQLMAQRVRVFAQKDGEWRKQTVAELSS